MLKYGQFCRQARLLLLVKPSFPQRNGKTMSKLLEMWNDESGQDLAEYAMMIGLVALAVVTAVMVLGTNVGVTFNAIGTTLEASI